MSFNSFNSIGAECCTVHVIVLQLQKQDSARVTALPRLIWQPDLPMQSAGGMSLLSTYTVETPFRKTTHPVHFTEFQARWALVYLHYVHGSNHLVPLKFFIYPG